MSWEDWERDLRRSIKLVLWYQLLRHGLFRSLLRYYGLIGLIGGVALIASLALLLGQRSTDLARFGKPWVVVGGCLSLSLLSYALGRSLGAVPTILLSVVLPGIFVITPAVVSPSAATFASNPDEAPAAATADLPLFFKGGILCGSLTLFSYGVFRFGRLSHRFGLKGWSLRRVTVGLVLGVSVVGLELLRIVLGGCGSFHPPWQNAVAHWLWEPGWPYAICVWLWTNLALLLALYDSRVISYLLHRTGHNWVPPEITIHEAYMVDSLLAALRQRPPRRHRHLQ